MPNIFLQYLTRQKKTNLENIGGAFLIFNQKIIYFYLIPLV